MSRQIRSAIQLVFELPIWPLCTLFMSRGSVVALWRGKGSIERESPCSEFLDSTREWPSTFSVLPRVGAA